jgi:hypothetical protein
VLVTGALERDEYLVARDARVPHMTMELLRAGLSISNMKASLLERFPYQAIEDHRHRCKAFMIRESVRVVAEKLIEKGETLGGRLAGFIQSTQLLRTFRTFHTIGSDHHATVISSYSDLITYVSHFMTTDGEVKEKWIHMNPTMLAFRVGKSKNETFINDLKALWKEAFEDGFTPARILLLLCTQKPRAKSTDNQALVVIDMCTYPILVRNDINKPSINIIFANGEDEEYVKENTITICTFIRSSLCRYLKAYKPAEIFQISSFQQIMPSVQQEILRTPALLALSFVLACGTPHSRLSDLVTLCRVPVHGDDNMNGGHNNDAFVCFEEEELRSFFLRLASTWEGLFLDSAENMVSPEMMPCSLGLLLSHDMV